MFVQAEGKQLDTVRVFDALIENFPDMVHSVDEHGNILYFNRMAAQLLGYSEDELRLMNISQLYPPEIMQAVEKGFREVKESGEKRVESLFMAKDGTRIPVELRTLVLHDEAGAFAQTFTVSRDLRNLKELQDNLIHASRLAALGELAAGVVHDLNNPLTAVILASSLLKTITDSPSLTPGDIRAQAALFCETITECASTMEHLTTSLRNFTRGVKEQHALLDLFEPIHDALFILGHRITSNNIRVQCLFSKGKHWTRGDHNQIEQVFLNLFSNACDAMAQSEERELKVDISLDALDGKPFWRCAVRDSGGGISPELQELIFKSFFTTKPRGKGTGLGLSIARSILKEHNGDIRLDSECGKGSTFSVLLPALTLCSS
jgi:PAS domain S-box-containing protein